MAFIPMIQSGGGTDIPDYSVFDDYANFDSPTLSSSVDHITGGYKVKGNLVYVYMTIYLKPSAFGTSTNATNVELISDLPECATWGPVPFGRWNVVTVMGGTLLKYSAGQGARIQVGLIPNEVKNLSDPRLITKFIYNKKH